MKIGDEMVVKKNCKNYLNGRRCKYTGEIAVIHHIFDTDFCPIWVFFSDGHSAYFDLNELGEFNV